jgi:hypothetical protein
MPPLSGRFVVTGSASGADAAGPKFGCGNRSAVGLFHSKTEVDPGYEAGGDARVLLLYAAQKQEQPVKQSRQRHSAAFKAKVALAALKGDRTEIENIAVTLRLVPTPMSNIDMAQ